MIRHVLATKQFLFVLEEKKEKIHICDILCHILCSFIFIYFGKERRNHAKDKQEQAGFEVEVVPTFFWSFECIEYSFSKPSNEVKDGTHNYLSKMKKKEKKI